MAKQDKAKIGLNASVNGSGLSHGEVCLDIAPTEPIDMASHSEKRVSIRGFTDTRGVFITNWSAQAPGEYMVEASVKKSGCVDGRTVCFIRSVE